MMSILLPTPSNLRLQQPFIPLSMYTGGRNDPDCSTFPSIAFSLGNEAVLFGVVNQITELSHPVCNFISIDLIDRHRNKSFNRIEEIATGKNRCLNYVGGLNQQTALSLQRIYLCAMLMILLDG